MAGLPRRRRREPEDLPQLLSDDALIEWGRVLNAVPDREWHGDAPATPPALEAVPAGAEVAAEPVEEPAAAEAQAEVEPEWVEEPAAAAYAEVEPEWVEEPAAEAELEVEELADGHALGRSGPAGREVARLVARRSAQLRARRTPDDDTPSEAAGEADRPESGSRPPDVTPPGRRRAPLVARTRRVALAPRNGHVPRTPPADGVPPGPTLEPASAHSTDRAPAPAAVLPPLRLPPPSDRLKARLADIDDD